MVLTYLSALCDDKHVWQSSAIPMWHWLTYQLYVMTNMSDSLAPSRCGTDLSALCDDKYVWQSSAIKMWHWLTYQLYVMTNMSDSLPPSRCGTDLLAVTDGLCFLLIRRYYHIVSTFLWNYKKLVKDHATGQKCFCMTVELHCSFSFDIFLNSKCLKPGLWREYHSEVSQR